MSVRGNVTDRRGRPIDATVEFYQGASHVGRARTRGGSFSVHLDPGTYTAIATLPARPAIAATPSRIGRKTIVVPRRGEITFNLAIGDDLCGGRASAGDDYVLVETLVPQSLVDSIRQESRGIAGEDFAPPAVLDIQPGSELERFGIEAALHAGMGGDLAPLKHLGTYTTAAYHTAAVFDVVGVSQKYLVVILGANNAVVAAWYTYGWTRNLAVLNLARVFAPATPFKDRWGSIVWRQWREVSAPNLAAYRYASTLGYRIALAATAGQEPRSTDLDEPTDVRYIDSFGDDAVPTQVINYPGPEVDIVTAGEVQPSSRRTNMAVPSNCKIQRLPSGVWVAECRINTSSGPIVVRGQCPERPILQALARRARQRGATAGQAPGVDIGGIWDHLQKLGRNVARSRAVQAVGRGIQKVAANKAVQGVVATAAAVYGVPPKVTRAHMDAISRMPPEMAVLGVATGAIGPMAAGYQIRDAVRRRDPRALLGMAKVAAKAKGGDPAAIDAIASVAAAGAATNPVDRAAVLRAAKAGNPTAVRAARQLLAARQIQRYAALIPQGEAPATVQATRGRPAARPAARRAAGGMAARIVVAARGGNRGARLAIARTAQAAKAGNPTAKRAVAQIVAANRALNGRGARALPGAAPGRLAAPAGGRARIVSATRLPTGQTRIVADVGGAGWDTFKRWLWNPHYRGEAEAVTLREGYRSGLDKMRAFVRARQAESRSLLPAGR